MPRRKSPTWIALAWLAWAALGAETARSQPPQEGNPARREEPRKSAWLHEVYLQDASAYEFSFDEEKRQKLELRREPVMRWTSDGDYNGEVYVWTHRGSAAIVGCIFSGPQGDAGRRIMHEFHSLAPHPLFAQGRAGSAWQPQEPGIAPKPIPDAPEPAKSRILRLAQMRELARRFTSRVDREGGKSEMRLLPQPLYRYEPPDDDPIDDGAVFAFVWTAGTDPEALLVLEAVRDGGPSRWHYALARFTNREAWAQYQGKEVWRAEPSTVGIFDGVTSKRYGAFSVKTITNPDDTP
jgi:hypothetical protein